MPWLGARSLRAGEPETVLRAHGPAATGVMPRVADDARYFSYAAIGMRRGNVAGQPSLSRVAMCDKRGNVRAAGGSSAARLLVTTHLRRARVVREQAIITDALDDTDQTCPSAAMRGQESLMTLILTNMQRRHRGFSLLEVLIALVIMSVGMLGIAGLYVQGMQAGRTSLFRHHAVTLAGDVADRIRANPRAGSAYAGPGSNRDCVATGAGCPDADMAANDIFSWHRQAQETLPNGDVRVAFDDAVSPPQYTISVTWTEPGEVLDYTITILVLSR